MRSAAQRQPEDDPGPGRAGLEAQAAGVLGAHRQLADRIGATLEAWGTGCPRDSEAVPALQAMGALVIDAGHHAEELRQALASYTAAAGALEAAFAAGRECERAAQAAPPAGVVPGPRHAAGKRLRVVKGGGVAAFAGLLPALRHAWTFHKAYTAAAAATAGIALTATTAAVVHPSSIPFTSSSPSASAAAGPVTAVQVPQDPQQKLIASITRPKDSRTLTVSMPPSVPAYVPAEAPPEDDGSAPAGSSPSQDQAPQVKLVVTTSLDLGTGSSGQIRVTAFGGTADWSASASDAGLMLDQSSGTLTPGRSAVITVSLTADLQALTGPGSVTISYGNKTVTVPVSWVVVPLPVPSPSDSPVDLPTLPAVLGS